MISPSQRPLTTQHNTTKSDEHSFPLRDSNPRSQKIKRLCLITAGLRDRLTKRILQISGARVPVLFSATSKEFEYRGDRGGTKGNWECLVKNTLHDVYMNFNGCKAAKIRSEIKMRNFYNAVNTMWEGKKKRGAQYAHTPEDFLIASTSVSAIEFNLCMYENIKLTAPNITPSIRIYFSDVGACLCNLCKAKFWLRQNCFQRCCS